LNPSYPVYIISKGRWESRLTSKSFEKMGVPYHIVIEPQEYDNYAAVIDPEKIFVLPFSNLGKGSIPARNWVWEHAIEIRAKRHWILDDNIRGFIRLNHNARVPVASGTIFKAAEDFVDRYENIALAGFGYRFMAGGHRRKKPPFRLNTGVYSCILIKNDIPYRWRGRYNEDSDLSIRVLKDGWCTLVFNAFMQNKVATMAMKGGNTDELYAGDGRLKMAQSLQEQHPDIVEIKRRFNRWQHVVDYRTFKENRLIKKDNLYVRDGINNYGMVLRKRNKPALLEEKDE
jgi:DNA-directed RNA polymerase subunit H (RpoH/RPB5)